MTGNRLYHKFLTSIRDITPDFISLELSKLLDEDGLPSTDFKTLLRKYHNWRRYNVKPARGRHGAFAATQDQDESPPLPTLNGRDASGKPMSPCICGDLHRYENCPYIVDAKQPRGWKPDSEKQRLVEEACENNRRIAGKVKYLRKRNHKTADNNSNANNTFGTNGSKPPLPVDANPGRGYAVYGAGTSNININDFIGTEKPTAEPMDTRFSARIDSAKLSEPITTSFSATFDKPENITIPTDAAFLHSLHAAFPITQRDYELKNSFILDSGSTIHICNDYDRFSAFRPAGIDEVVYAGNGEVAILGYGIITIVTECPGFPRGKPITFKNVAYCPGFQTNIISLQHLVRQGTHWDTEHLVLKENGCMICYTPFRYGQYTLEYNPLDHEQVVNAAQNSHKPLNQAMGTAEDWHKRLGHLYYEAINHLETSTRGAKVTTRHDRSCICETCRLGNAREIISRRPYTRGTRPFHTLCVDWVYMTEGLNDESKMMHTHCDFCYMNFIFALPDLKQSTIVTTLRRLVKYLKRRWGFTVVIIKMDGQTGLEEQWTILIQDEEGIEIQESAPDTHDQNDPAERAGGVVIGRSRVMRIGARLPTHLHPYITMSAGYLLNRSPTRQLGWKTPLGFLQQYLEIKNPEPIIAHLRAYGCKAFPLKKNIPKLDKLEARAWIGWLVGYKGTNIFLIWVPLLRRVIATRDVTFDESSFYDPKNETTLTEIETLQLVEIIELTDIPEVGYDDFIPEPLGVGAEYERSIDAPGDTVVVKDTSEIQQPQQLRTPELTPESTPEPTQFPVATNVPDVLTSQPSLVSGLDQPSQDSLTERTHTPDDLTVDSTNSLSNDTLSTEASASRNTTQSTGLSSVFTYPKKLTQLVSTDLLQEHIQIGKRIRKQVKRFHFIQRLQYALAFYATII